MEKINSLMLPFHAIKSIYGHVKMVHAEAWGVGDLSLYEHQRKNTGIYFGGDFFFFFLTNQTKSKQEKWATAVSHKSNLNGIYLVISHIITDSVWG